LHTLREIAFDRLDHEAIAHLAVGMDEIEALANAL
jgi:hypothetical protein